MFLSNFEPVREFNLQSETVWNKAAYLQGPLGHGTGRDVSTSPVEPRPPQIISANCQGRRSFHVLAGEVCSYSLLSRFPNVFVGFKQGSNIHRLPAPYVAMNSPVQ